MANKKDYLQIPAPPADQDPTTYKVDQRRAELARIVIAAGDIDALEPSKICTRYGKTQGQLSHDKKAILPTFKRHYNPERIKDDVLVTKIWALKTAKKQGDYKAASQIADTVLSMMYDLGLIEKAAEKFEGKFMEVRWKKTEEEETTE